MPDDRDTKFLQILCRQMREDRLIYVILTEYPLIPFEAKAPQPLVDNHDNAKAPDSAYVGWSLDDVRP